MLTVMLCMVMLEPSGKDVFEKRCTGCHLTDENRMGRS